MGTIYGEHNASQQSKEYYIKAGDLATKIGDIVFASTCYASASGVSGKGKQALELMTRALKYAALSDDVQMQGDKWLVAAGVYYDNGLVEKAMDSYRNAMKCFEQVGDRNSYNMAQSGLTFLFNKTTDQDSAWLHMNASDANTLLAYSADSLAMPNSMQGLKLDLLNARVVSEQRATKLDVLSKQYWEQQAINLRRQVWLISIVAILIFTLLLLLYNRQRLRTKTKTKYIEGLENERTRISKELHDGVCNDLLALEMELKSGAGERQMNFLRSVRHDVRILSHELLPPSFQYATIDEILLDYATSLNTPQGVDFRYSQSDEDRWSDIPQMLALHIYRIVQEAVSNSLRHAQASEITVHLVRHNRQVEVEISDNGVGFDTHNNSSVGVGLRTITDRVHSVGGTLDIRSGNEGTTLRAIFNIY